MIMNNTSHKKTVVISIVGVIVVLGLAIFLWWSANQGKTETVKETENDSTALQVGVMPTLDCLPVFVAQYDSLFKQQGVEVNLKTFSAQIDCDTAIISGKVKLAFTDVIRAQRMIRKKVPIDFYSSTMLGWKFITNLRSRIREMQDLDEKLVGVSRFSGGDYLAELAIDSAKMKREKVFRVQINDWEIRLRMLLNNELDGVLLPEPYATEAQNANNKTLYDFSKSAFRLGAMVVRTDNKKDSVMLNRFARAYDMAVDSINKNGLKYYDKVFKKYYKAKGSTIDSLKPMTFRHIEPVSTSDKNLAQQWLDRH